MIVLFCFPSLTALSFNKKLWLLIISGEDFFANGDSQSMSINYAVLLKFKQSCTKYKDTCRL